MVEVRVVFNFSKRANRVVVAAAAAAHWAVWFHVSHLSSSVLLHCASSVNN